MHKHAALLAGNHVQVLRQFLTLGYAPKKLEAGHVLWNDDHVASAAPALAYTESQISSNGSI